MSETEVFYPRGRHAREVFWAFLKLGLTSFGGPIAHLGFFRDELVLRRRWLTESAYAELVALCQFLPGPASSQVGFALGYLRAGLPGAILAWTAFTLPSALLLFGFAISAPAFSGELGSQVIHGLKLVAVAIVAQAVWGMARTLAPDRERATIALAATILVVLLPTALAQLIAIAVGAAAGLVWCRGVEAKASAGIDNGISRRTGALLILAFLFLLVGLPLAVAWAPASWLSLFEAFYRAGALVFGGGHVVLPLLETGIVGSGWVSTDEFLAGYGAAQAVPGPLFTFAAYLGALNAPGPDGWAGATIALLAIFLPGLLLLMGVLPFWQQLSANRRARAGIAGANAAVVGILGAALYDPVWTGAVISGHDFAVALIAFVLLTTWRWPPWRVVVLTVLGSVGLAMVST